MEIFKKRLTFRTDQKNVPQMKRTLIYTKNKHKHIKLFLIAFKSLSGALHSNSKRYQFHAGVVHHLHKWKIQLFSIFQLQ